MATRTVPSLQEFDSLPEDGMLHEMDKGELVTVTHPKFRHMRVVQTVNELLAEVVKANSLGGVLTEMGYLLSEDAYIEIPGCVVPQRGATAAGSP